MKKILIIVILSLLSLTAFAQIPFKIHNKDIRFKWGSDSMRFDITGKGFYLRDTIYFADGTKQWSADTVGGVAGNWSMSGLKIYPTTPNAYVNTDSSYYIKGVDFIRYNNIKKNISIGNVIPSGISTGTNNIILGDNCLASNTTGSDNIAIGLNSLEKNTTGGGNTSIGNSALTMNTIGTQNTSIGKFSLASNTKGSANTAIGTSSLEMNTEGRQNTAIGKFSAANITTGSANTAIGYGSLFSSQLDSFNIAIGYLSGYNAFDMSNTLWIGQGDSNNAIIYGEMLTRPRIRINGALNVKSVITNGGLINRDTVLVLVDDATFSFPATSVGWAEIQCDSLLIEKTWGVVSWNGDGSTSLRSNGAKFVNTDIDGNYACFYDGGAYAILRNTSGSTQTYSIKYHYHN